MIQSGTEKMNMFIDCSWLWDNQVISDGKNLQQDFKALAFFYSSCPGQ